MDRAKLEQLIDPVDASPLQLQDAVEGEHGVDSGILVGRSGRRYRIERGVPRFVHDDEQLASFSFEWLTHARTLFDREPDEALAGRPVSLARLRRWQWRWVVLGGVLWTALLVGAAVALWQWVR